MGTKMQVQVQSRGLGTELVKGAVAGAVATWTMGAVTSFLYEQADAGNRRRETRARRGRTPYGAAAEKVAALFGEKLGKEERERIGAVIHWTLGIGAGALYAGVRHGLSREDGSRGIALGATFWGLVDEGLNPALGLTPGPDRFPWQAHARGLAGHLSYGVMVDGTLRILDRFA
jgi:hypothetical protein